MNQDNLHSYIEPELEARIVALVLGEASDFEREELERLIAKTPELAFFKKRIETVHGLLHEVAKGEPEVDDAEWKLPGHSRQKILATIEGTPANKSQTVATASTAKSSSKKTRPRWTRIVQFAAAACLVIGVSASALMFSMKDMILMEAAREGAADSLSYSFIAPSRAAGQASAGSTEESFDLYSKSAYNRSFAAGGTLSLEKTEADFDTDSAAFAFAYPETDFKRSSERYDAVNGARAGTTAAGFQSAGDYIVADTGTTGRSQSSLDAIRSNLSSFSTIAENTDDYGVDKTARSPENQASTTLASREEYRKKLADAAPERPRSRSRIELGRSINEAAIPMPEPVEDIVPRAGADSYQRELSGGLIPRRQAWPITGEPTPKSSNSTVSSIVTTSPNPTSSLERKSPAPCP